MSSRRHTNRALRRVLLPALAALLCAGLLGAAEKVSFTSGTDLLVSKVEEKGELYVLHLLEGGQIAVPKEVVAAVSELDTAQAMEEWRRRHKGSGDKGDGERSSSYQAPMTGSYRSETGPSSHSYSFGGNNSLTREKLMSTRPEYATNPSRSVERGRHTSQNQEMLKRIRRGEKLPGSEPYGREAFMGDAKERKK